MLIEGSRDDTDATQTLREDVARYCGKIGLLKRSIYGTRDAASNWERDWQEHGKNWDISWDSARRICFDMRGKEFQE